MEDDCTGAHPDVMIYRHNDDFGGLGAQRKRETKRVRDALGTGICLISCRAAASHVHVYLDRRESEAWQTKNYSVAKRIASPVHVCVCVLSCCHFAMFLWG